MFDQNNVNLAPDAIGTRPRSSTTIPIAHLLAISLASTGDARAEITLRSMITGYRAQSRHWQPQPKQPSAPLKPASNLCIDRLFFPEALRPLQFRKPILGNFNLFKPILAFLPPLPPYIFSPILLVLVLVIEL